MSDWASVLAEASKKIGAVKKGDRNTQQNYNFRGVDAVVNAVHPVFTEIGIIVTPELRHVEYADYESGKNRTPMIAARVIVAFRFHYQDLEPLVVVVAAEAGDSGDKATPKAMSVAFRTCLLQVLMLPTGDPEPDSHTYEIAPKRPAKPARPAEPARPASPTVEIPQEYIDTIDAATTTEQLVTIGTNIPDGEGWTEAAKAYARARWEQINAAG